jgi:protein involved in polysaccharide export with SLBB domain
MPPDVISISSNYVREINSITQQIRPDGKISLPLAGDIYVAGMTPEEIRGEIEAIIRRYYKKVDITVYVDEYKSQKVFIFGEVVAPGPLPWTGSDTLLDVLAQTQPTRLAWPQKIKIIRAKKPTRGGYMPDEAILEQCAKGQEPVIGNSDETTEMVIDLQAMVETGDLSHNVLLQPDDIIFVPPNPFAAVGLALQQVLFPMSQASSIAKVPADIDNNTYLHWKYRDRYYNVIQNSD